MNLHTRPDWVILGDGQTDGGVMVLASTQLTRAELEMVHERHQYLEPLESFRFNHQRITLAIEMGKFVIIVAPDYPTAMKRLFEQWEPRAADRPAVEGRRTLPGNVTPG